MDNLNCKVTPMPLVIAMTHLVTALSFLIQILFESRLVVFADLERIIVDKSTFYIKENSRLELATEFALP